MSVKAVPKNTGSSDAEILSRARVEITLAGKSYEWTEVGRRQSRGMIQEILSIAEKLRRGSEENDSAALLGAVDEILDFFYRNHAGMRRDREHLDNSATNFEVMEAFKAVREVIDCPFRRDLAAAKEDGTLTLNPEPSN